MARKSTRRPPLKVALPPLPKPPSKLELHQKDENAGRFRPFVWHVNRIFRKITQEQQ